MNINNKGGFFALDENDLNEYKARLNEEELSLLTVSKCQSHQLTLVCAVNESNSLKRDFCEKDFKWQQSNIEFLCSKANEFFKKMKK